MSDAPDLFAWEPPVRFGTNFDGATFEKARDGKRLNAQLASVFRAMRDGKWHTLSELHALTGAPEASVSARIRDCKKTKFGGHTVERRFVTRGLFEYRLIENQGKTS